MCYENLIKALAFFDLFDQPLTKDEVLKYAWGFASSSLPEERSASPEGGLRGVGEKDGFYFLTGREEIVKKRQERQNDLEKKLKIAKRAVKKLRWVPFLQAVFLCNNLALGTADKDSDIDIFIVARDGRIWMARFFATLFLQIFFLRRHGRKVKNRVCLSFYISDKYLNLREIRIEPPDAYLVYWLASLIPVYDPAGIFKKVKQANQWILEYVPNGFIDVEVGKNVKVDDDKFSKLFKKALEKMWQGSYGNLIENQLREIQKTKMKMNLHSKQNENNNDVVINDKMLKFHENDRRKYYQDLWKKSC